PHWLLSVESLRVHLEAVERLTGTTAAVPATLHPSYLGTGLHMAANPAGTYLKLATKTQLALDGPRGGGLAQPPTAPPPAPTRRAVLAANWAGRAAPGGSLAGIFGGAKLFGPVDLARILGDIPAPGPGTVGLADLPEKAFADLLADPHRLVPIPVLRSRQII